MAWQGSVGVPSKNSQGGPLGAYIANILAEAAIRPRAAGKKTVILFSKSVINRLFFGYFLDILGWFAVGSST